MDAKNILVVGAKGSVLAFRRDTGEPLWSTHLQGSDFVSVVADEQRVYVHTHGELFCLDLFSGDGIWSDPLKGFGYGPASLALPDVTAPDALFQKKRLDEAAAQSAATVAPG